MKRILISFGFGMAALAGAASAGAVDTGSETQDEDAAWENRGDFEYEWTSWDFSF